MKSAAVSFRSDGVPFPRPRQAHSIFLFIQTTASDAALTEAYTAIVAARTRYLNNPPGTTLESLVIYVTIQTHSFGKEAALILGLRVQVRALGVDVTIHG